MEIVMVQFRDRKNKEQFHDREYGYYTKVPLKVGDVIMVPLANGEAAARVNKVGVRMRTIEKFVEPEE